MDLLSELRRRRVPRTALVYVISVWVVIQVADIVLSAFDASTLFLRGLIIVGILGFPLVVVLAWLFELTPQGIHRTSEHDTPVTETPVHRRTVNFVVIVLLCLAVLLMIVDNYLLTDQGTREVTVSTAPSRSVAVLPFKNRSAATENAEFFANGVHDDLVTLLSKVRGMRVISRASVDRFKDSDLTLQEIAASLGTTKMLEGGVQQSGDRVRINVQLVDVGSDRNIWAETYDRELTAVNVFEIQSEIAAQIAAALEAKLTRNERTELAQVPTENLDAYRAYLFGKERMDALSTASLEQAIEHFRQAIAMDPDFAAAYIGLADANLYLIDFGALEERAAVARARPFVEKALQLDPNSGEAYVTLGAIRFYELDYPGAEEAYRHALELKPNYVQAHQWYADLLIRMGRPEQALGSLRAAQLLDPLSPSLAGEIVDALAALGQFDAALAELGKVIEMSPDHQLTYWREARIRTYALGRFDESLAWMDKSLAIDPGDAFGTAFVGALYAALGDPAAAERWIGRALELGPNSSFALSAGAALAERTHDPTRVAELSERIIAAWGLNGYARAFARLRDLDVADGRAADAIDRYRQHFPGLFNPDEPAVGAANYEAAAGLAALLYWTGDTAQAARLSDAVFEVIDTLPRLGWAGYGIVDVQLYAVQGRVADALTALRAAVDSGWRPILDVPLDQDPSLKALRQAPEFAAILAEIDADMAAQLVRAQAMATDA